MPRPTSFTTHLPRIPIALACVCAAALLLLGTAGTPRFGKWGTSQQPSALSVAADELRTELSREFVTPERILEIRGRADTVYNADNLLSADGRTARIAILPDEELAIILDFGREVVGYFRARTVGGFATFDLAYGESLEECLQTRPLQPIDRRNSTPGEWVWTDTERRAFRYMKVTVSHSSGPLEIDYIGLDLVGYPVEERGYFRSSDEMLNRIWEVGRYTTRLSMQDYFEDGIKRDRLLWIGDMRVQALSAYYAFGDYKLAKRDLIRLADLQLHDGSLPAFGPISSSLIIPDYCAYWVSTVWEHYMHSGDKTIVELLFPTVRRQMDWFSRQLTPDLLVENTRRKGWWCFIDWGDIDRRDEVTALSVAHYHALLSAAGLADVIGKPEDAEKYNTLAESVRQSINDNLWLSEQGAYSDCRTADGLSARISQQTNCLAILFGVADRERWDSITSMVFDESRVLPTMTPYMNFYVARTLYHVGADQQALDLIRYYWGGMVRRGATTYWEAYDPRKPDSYVPDSSMSHCHGWSGGVTSILPAEVAGIKPVQPGFQSVSVIPQLADLDWAEARVPTPHGDVFASWRRSQDRRTIDGTIRLPEVTSGIIGVPVGNGDTRILMNNVPVWNRGEVSSPLPANLDKVSSDDRYVYLAVDRGGEYHIHAVSLDAQ